MKKLFFLFALMAFSCIASAQQNDFAVDSTVTVKIGNVFYLDDYKIREDGTGNIPERTLIGDSLDYFRHLVNRHVLESREWASATYATSKYNKVAAKLNTYQADGVAQTGKSVRDTIQSLFESKFLGSWRWKNGGTTTVTVTKNANGTLRAANLPGAASPRTLSLRSDFQFLIINYPTDGVNTVLVSQDGKVFRDSRPDINITFRKVGN